MTDLIQHRTNAPDAGGRAGLAALSTAAGRTGRRNMRWMPALILLLAFWALAPTDAVQADDFAGTEHDRHLAEILKGKRSQWRDLNVPYQDGEFLRNFVAGRSMRSVVEIGTSTGHSGLWIAWGLTKTGGRLVTFEIDRERHATARQNFTAARVSALIDARLESARTGVLALTGPIDMVFLDGDHGHYRHYVETLAPLLSDDGCFLTHNIERPFWDGQGYLAMVRGIPGFATEVVRPGEEAIAVTCRRPTS